MTRRLLAFSLALSLSSVARASNWLVPTDFAQVYDFNALLQGLDDADVPIDAWAVDVRGEWMVVADSKVFASDGFSPDVVTAAKWNLFYGRDILAADCSTTTCMIVHSMGWYADGALPAGLTDKLSTWSRNGWRVRDVEITTDGWTLLGDGDLAAWSSVPSDLQAILADRVVSKRFVQDVGIGLDGTWAVVSEQNPVTSWDASATLSWQLGENAKAGEHLEHMLLGDDGAYVLYNGADTVLAPDASDPWTFVEYGLKDGKSLWQRMEDQGAVGIGVALISHDQVIGSRGYGIRSTKTDDPVLGTTPFDLASLSKYVAALTTLDTLDDIGEDVETDILSVKVKDGNIDLWKSEGENNASYYFWPSGLPDLPSGLTYRRLLSHTSSLGATQVGGTMIPFFYVDQDIPTWQWMMGYGCVMNGCGYDPDQRAWPDPNLGNPGDQYQYTSADFLAARASLEDHTGKTGGELVDEHIFQPLGLKHVNAHYPMSDSFEGEIAWPHSGGVANSTLYEYPGTFSGGIYASPGDYAEIMILALNDGRSSKDVEVVAPEHIHEMLESQFITSGVSNYGFGLGIGSLVASEENEVGFRHSGRHPGRSYSYECGVPGLDVGIVVLSNNDDADTRSLVKEIVRAWRNGLGLTDSCGV